MPWSLSSLFEDFRCAASSLALHAPFRCACSLGNRFRVPKGGQVFGPIALPGRASRARRSAETCHDFAPGKQLKR